MTMLPLVRTAVSNLTRSGSVMGYSLGGVVILVLAVIGILALLHRA
jgi:hypothetical protein